MDRPRPRLRSGRRMEPRRTTSPTRRDEPQGRRNPSPAVVPLNLQLAQVRRRRRDALMSQERAHVFDRGARPSSELRRCVPQDVRRDTAETRSRCVAPQVGVEGGVGHRKDKLAIPDWAACGVGTLEDRPPRRLREFAAPDPATLGANLIHDHAIRRRRYPKLDEFSPPKAREDAGQNHRPIQQSGSRVRDDRQQPAHLFG